MPPNTESVFQRTMGPAPSIILSQVTDCRSVEHHKKKINTICPLDAPLLRGPNDAQRVDKELASMDVVTQHSVERHPPTLTSHTTRATATSSPAYDFYRVHKSASSIYSSNVNGCGGREDLSDKGRATAFAAIIATVFDGKTCLKMKNRRQQPEPCKCPDGRTHTQTRAVYASIIPGTRDRTDQSVNIVPINQSTNNLSICLPINQSITTLVDNVRIKLMGGGGASSNTQPPLMSVGFGD